MDAYQYFFDADGNQTGYQEVGHLHWDAKPSHQHWHFEDFARYTLLRRGQDRRRRCPRRRRSAWPTPTPSTSPSPSADWKPENTDLATSCGDHDLAVASVRCSRPAGATPTRSSAPASPSASKNLPNGVYFIAVIANPDGNLVETSTTNNRRPAQDLRLGGKERPAHRAA